MGFQSCVRIVSVCVYAAHMMTFHIITNNSIVISYAGLFALGPSPLHVNSDVNPIVLSGIYSL